MKCKLLAAAIGVLALNANATTVDWGVHGNLEVAAPFADPGSFEDTIVFSLPGTVDVSSTTVANNLLSVLGLEDGRVSLYREEGAADTLVGQYSFDGTTGSTSHTYLTLTTGDYYYLISGVATGSEGAFYSISSTVTAVPEPATYAMWLGGLGLVGLLRRRRKSP